MLLIGNGYYRVDYPDAAFASGVTGVLLHGTATGMVVIGEYYELVAYDPTDAVRLGLTALPNADADTAGGLPISDAGGLDLDAILADTAELQGDWVNGGRLDLLIDAIKAATDNLPADPADASDIAAAFAALNDVSVADILTTQMTEAYAADGVAPTLAQAIFLIQQKLTEFAIASTTLTVKKLDGTTTAATFTLDDDTNPTSITRAS